MGVMLGDTPLPLEQPVDYRFDRINGTTYTRTWVGAKAYIDVIAAAEADFAEGIHVSGRGATYTLVARYTNPVEGPQGEVPSETQELDTAAIQQSIFFNPYFQVLSAHGQMLVRKVFDNRETRTDALTVFDAALAVGEVNGIERPLMEEAYDLMVMGAESYETHAFTLTRTRTASRQYTGTLTLTKIGSLWTTAELANYVGNPLLFVVPSLSLTVEETDKNLFAGWRQTMCRVSDTAVGSRQMIEQWQLAKWSLLLYARQNSIP